MARAQLQLDVRNYLAMLRDSRFWSSRPNGVYRETLEFLRALYETHGRAAVRAEVKRQHPAHLTEEVTIDDRDEDGGCSAAA